MKPSLLVLVLGILCIAIITGIVVVVKSRGLEFGNIGAGSSDVAAPDPVRNFALQLDAAIREGAPCSDYPTLGSTLFKTGISVNIPGLSQPAISFQPYCYSTPFSYSVYNEHPQVIWEPTPEELLERLRKIL